VSFFTDLFAQNPIVCTLFGAVVFVVLWAIKRGAVFIPNTCVGVREKVLFGNKLEGGFIAMNGECGFEPDVLRGGLHFMPPFTYRVHTVPLVTISQGKIGYIFARDGAQLPPTQTLASNENAQDFTDVRDFLSKGGQKGVQRMILREGTYAINLAQFFVITEEQVYAIRFGRDDDESFRRIADTIASRNGFSPVVITDDLVGIVTAHDGASLETGEIVAPVVGEDHSDANTYHNSFQDPEKFLRAGGCRGRQLQVLVEGTYYINRLFATVEMIPKTVVEVGQVGVVVSYTGDKGADLSGVDYKHGEMVSKGSRGVWNEPMMPGKYAFNTYAGKVIMVPTTNFILKWHKNESGAHKFDENLSEVTLITKDAFEPLLPLSVVVHIDYRKAPLVIQRFGDIKRLVDQTLDPMVAAYFKNIGQSRTLIQLIQDRSSIQMQASDEMKENFGRYNLELQEVLIGTPTSSEGDKRIEDILTQLRSRQIAEEQVVTYAQQEKAAVKERELREAESRAKQQSHLTESELAIQVQANQGKAEAQRALQQREQIHTLAEAEASKNRTLAEAEAAKVRMLADAEASRIKAIGEAEAEKTARLGIAQAIAVEEQVKAYGGPRFQLTQQVMGRFAEAIERGGIDVVPKIQLGGGGGGTHEGMGMGGNVLEGLLALMLSDKMTESLGNGNGHNTSGQGMMYHGENTDPQRAAIRNNLLNSVRTNPSTSTVPQVPNTPSGLLQQTPLPPAPPPMPPPRQ
jgi:uncharacterized membrane protein YqiK